MELNEEECRNIPLFRDLANLTAKAFLKDYKNSADSIAFHALACLVATGKLQQSAELDKVMAQIADVSENRICCMMVAEEIVKLVKEENHGA